MHVCCERLGPPTFTVLVYRPSLASQDHRRRRASRSRRRGDWRLPVDKTKLRGPLPGSFEDDSPSLANRTHCCWTPEFRYWRYRHISFVIILSIIAASFGTDRQPRLEPRLAVGRHTPQLSDPQSQTQDLPRAPTHRTTPHRKAPLNSPRSNNDVAPLLYSSSGFRLGAFPVYFRFPVGGWFPVYFRFPVGFRSRVSGSGFSGF